MSILDWFQSMINLLLIETSAYFRYRLLTLFYLSLYSRPVGSIPLLHSLHCLFGCLSFRNCFICVYVYMCVCIISSHICRCSSHLCIEYLLKFVCVCGLHLKHAFNHFRCCELVNSVGEKANKAINKKKK